MLVRNASEPLLRILLRLHRAMNGIPRHIQEKRLRLMSVDETHRLPCQSVGQILALLHGLGPPHHRVLSIVRRLILPQMRHHPGIRWRHKEMPLVQEAIELVKPALLRVKRGGRPQVPFPHHPGRITHFLEPLRQRRLRQRQPHGRVQIQLPCHVQLMPESRLIAPGQQPRP